MIDGAVMGEDAAMGEGAVATATLSKSQAAYHWVKQHIASGDFAPGHRLVLGAIATELAMSVVPVREAIRQLEAEGLVTFQRNVGAHVAMVDEAGYARSMQTLSIVEAAATALAAPYLRIEDVREAREVNDRMFALLEDFDPHTFTALNLQFHTILFRRCDNPRLVEVVRAEWARLGNLRESIFAFVPERAQESVREHADLIALIEGGASLPEIEHAMRQHRAHTLQALLTRDHPADHTRAHHAATDHLETGHV